ncbi:MAG TPA: hypothetical protein DIT75_03655 [Rikenellaceae bacterium]|nr:hypothetical protein [Rikenellaceae bacterium]
MTLQLAINDMAYRVSFHQILLMALVPVLLLSCSHSSVEGPEADTDAVIGFSTVSQELDSRSTGSTLISNLNVQGSEIAVYGFHGSELDYSGEIPVFETEGAKRVCYKSDGQGQSNWDYDYIGSDAASSGVDKVKWIRSDRYRFRAFYPYSLMSEVNNTSSAKVLQMRYSLMEHDSDLMVAYATRCPAEDSEGVAPVKLEFKHALSALKFIIKKENTNETEKVKEFYLTGLHQAGGLYYFASGASNLKGDQTIMWIPGEVDEDTFVHHWNPGNETKYKEIVAGGVSVYDDKGDKDGFVFAIPMNGEYEGKKWVDPLPSIYAHFKTDKGGSVLHTAKLPDIPWEPGKKYIYTITVKHATVSVEVKIKPWTEVEASAEIKL